MAVRQTPYEAWMTAQGVPIHKGYGIPDARLVDRQPWPALGGRAAFIQLEGMEGFTGMWVGEIPPRQALEPQKHMYQEVICVLEGRGAAEVWLPGDEAHKSTFEWGRHSLFAVPLNCWYRLYNGGSEPAIFLAVTDAPMILDIFHSEDFVFGNDYRFVDRFTPSADYFQGGSRHEEAAGMIWETNLIDDVGRALVDPQERKGAGVRITAFDMARNTLAGHLAEWPVGRYHKCHHHQGGAILLILRSQGYTLMWPLEEGVRPYQDGREDSVVRVDWTEGAVLSPPTKWFHQHFNTGTENARQLAFRFGSNTHPTGFRRSGSRVVRDVPGVYVSYREGGTLIEYEDEDPRIRQDYETEIARSGIASQMPPFTYRR